MACLFRLATSALSSFFSAASCCIPAIITSHSSSHTTPHHSGPCYTISIQTNPHLTKSPHMRLHCIHGIFLPCNDYYTILQALLAPCWCQRQGFVQEASSVTQMAEQARMQGRHACASMTRYANLYHAFYPCSQCVCTCKSKESPQESSIVWLSVEANADF